MENELQKMGTGRTALSIAVLNIHVRAIRQLFQQALIERETVAQVGVNEWSIRAQSGDWYLPVAQERKAGCLKPEEIVRVLPVEDKVHACSSEDGRSFRPRINEDCGIHSTSIFIGVEVPAKRPLSWKPRSP